MGGVLRRGTLGLAAVAALLAAWTLVAAASDDAPAGRAAGPPPLRQILAVSNNWDGTVDLVDAHTFRRLKRLDIVPDRAERMAEIETDPQRLAFFLAIRQQIGEGHDQLADDAFTSPDGRLIYVSRPSFADVVAINMKTGRIVDRAHRRRDRHPEGADRRPLPLRRLPAREQLLQERQADLPRQHRPRLHAPRRPQPGLHEG
jgi:hypothetical protein